MVPFPFILTYKNYKMKNLRFIQLAVFLFAAVLISSAQDKTESFRVSGNCGMCKSRIEKAAKEAGASSAKWESATQLLTVSYSSTGTNAAKIQQKLAEVGHDNDLYTATAEVYNKLPGCCKYDRKAAAPKEEKEMKCSMDGHEGKECCKKEEAGMDCCKEGKCKNEGKCDKPCCKKTEGEMDCCKDGKCSKEGHNGKDCCKKEDGKMDCCKDGKCSKEGHDGKDCCKKS